MTTHGARTRAIERIAAGLLLAAASLLLAVPSWAARITDVRVGRHADFTRVVFQLDARAGYRIVRQSAAPGREDLLVYLDASSPGAETVRGVRPLLERVDVKPHDGGTAARLRLAKSGLVVKEMILSDPPRIVLDVMNPEPAKTAKPASKPSAPARTTAKPKPAEPKPVAERAEPRAAVPAPPRAEPKPAPAAHAEPKPRPEAMAKATPPAPAPQPAVPVKPPAASQPKPSPAPAPPKAQPKPTPPPAARPEPAAPEPPPATRPEPGPPAPPASAAQPPQPAARPAVPPPLAPKPAPPAAHPTPPARAVTPRAEEPGMGLVSKLGIAGAVAGVVLIVAFVLLRRRGAAQNEEIAEGFEAEEAESGDPFAGLRSTPGAASETTAVMEPDAGAGLFDDDSTPAAAPGQEEQKELDMDMHTEPSEARTAANTKAPRGGAAGGDVMQVVRELERRMAHLESRLDEEVDARERLERQVAAQTEELRVQRAAIARTQRALRNMTRPEDDAATEPAPREQA